ncbi:MAG: SET domain-containing protein-lysine N-methyltransferase [Gammaproteobacteria bacterium]|nr:SET domain-containing protein-lysine N-methyltransferase [Gammaproteobacteria bacterium]
MREIIERLEERTGRLFGFMSQGGEGARSASYDVRKSAIHGFGLHSVRGFGQGEKIGTLIKRNPQGKYTDADGLKYDQTKLGDYVNHSRTPNMDSEWNGDDLVVFARQRIKPNSEMVIDYRKAGILVKEPK